MMKFSTKQKHRIVIALLALPLLLGGCMVEVPSHIIQPDDMEDLLYDYHLMQAMAGELNSSQNHKRKLYEQYVFDNRLLILRSFCLEIIYNFNSSSSKK